MRIFIQSPAGRIITLEAEPTDTAGALLANLEEKEGA
jgi:hypothetical protein